MTDVHPAHMPKIIAHRGASAHAPENTLAAIRKAAEIGARAVELDVQVSRDGVPVLLHDETLERTTDGHGFALQATIAELEELDAGAWFTTSYYGEPVPRLAAALELVASLDLTLNLELKPVLGWEEATARAVADVIRDTWPSHRGLLTSSLNPLALAVLRDELKDLGGVGYALITCAVPENWKDRLAEAGAAALHCHEAFVTPALAADVHAAGHRLHVYTVNDLDRARALFSAGVDAVFTDEPGHMQDLIDDD